DSTPLVAAGETNGQRIAALTFDLRESDLPLQVAYPILFSNLINYLAPPSAFDASQSLSAGETLTLVPPTDVEKIIIATPSNIAYTLAAGQTLFSETNELGYYAVNFTSKDAAKAEYFAVNLFDPAESNISPREKLQIGNTAVTPAVSQQVGLQEVWQWLAGLALIALMIEWQVFHRKPFKIRIKDKG
ncbi:MAG: hypothetical protein LDL51_04510, partial [Chloroflexi bacterium]|nr:hypothetical protein [Chloroflexota bacterium]